MSDTDWLVNYLFYYCNYIYYTGNRRCAHSFVWNRMLLQMLWVLYVFGNLCIYSLHTYHNRSIYTCRELFAYISTIIKDGLCLAKHTRNIHHQIFLHSENFTETMFHIRQELTQNAQSYNNHVKLGSYYSPLTYTWLNGSATKRD